jgi:hypothetical protein
MGFANRLSYGDRGRLDSIIIVTGVMRAIIAIARGKKPFHVKYIRWS